MARYPVAVLGGTFDRLHAGHEALLATAFRVGEEVGIGVTTDAFLRGSAKPLLTRIAPYATRRRALARWLRAHEPGRTWWIVPLDNPFGRSVEPGVDVLVASVDTREGARKVNRERRRRGERPLPVVLVPLALADDLQPISSRRIRAGVIDPTGRRLSRIDIDAEVDPAARGTAQAALEQVYPAVSIRWARSGATPTPPGRARNDRRPAEIRLRVARLRSDPAVWRISVGSGRIRLPTIDIPSGSTARLRRAIVRRLSPRLFRSISTRAHAPTPR